MAKAKRVFHGFTYFFLFLGCLFLADFYKHPLFLFLLMLIAGLLPLSIVVCKKAFAGLSCEIAFPVPYGQSSQVIPVSLRLVSTTFFPLPRCEITYQITSPFYPCEQCSKVICPAYAKGEFSFDLPVRFERSGVYQISIRHISCTDYLHIFPFQRELSVCKELMIFPRPNNTVSFDKTSYGEGFDEFEETSAKGNVSSNVTDIREYIPGDRLQKIHWKLSMKIDKLMIKENEQTASNQFSLLVELFLDRPESDVLERALSNAYAVAKAMLQAGEPFFFLFFSAKSHDFCSFLIRCEEDLENALTQCFYQPTYEEEDLGLHTLMGASIVHGILIHATHRGIRDVIS